MKKILLGITGFLIIIVGRCDCASSGIYFWPDKTTIPQNSIFIIEGYAYSIEMVKNLSDKYKVYLTNDEEKIELKAIEILPGEFFLTQVILKPEHKLNVGKEYQLEIEGIPKLDLSDLTRYNNQTNKWEPVKWLAGNTYDTIPPRWNKEPVYKNDTWIEYGCGPEVSANFMIDGYDESEMMIGAEVKNLKTNSTTIYYLRLEKDNLLAIGHGMCSGAFYLEGGKQFSVTFSLIDVSGNETNWTGPPLKFNCPTPKYR